MLIGIFSDTHNHLNPAREAIDRLRNQGAAYLIHCGDIGTAVLDLLGGVPSAFVFGNTDFDRVALAELAKRLDVRCMANFGTVELDGKRIAVTHGDDARRVKQVLDDQEHDYLLTGHSHVRHDLRVGRTRHINPGALFRTSAPSAALLELSSDVLRFEMF